MKWGENIMSNNKGHDNLIPVTELPKEEARKIQSKGGKARAKKMREKKKLREILEMYLEMRDDEGVSNKDKISLAIIEQAEKGNVKAFETIRDTIGEKPVEMIGFQDIELVIENETETE